MVVNINETIKKIKDVGPNNVRVVPMQNQPVDGDHQIEVYFNSAWATILIGVKRAMAEDIVRQATNRVLLG